MKDKLPGFTERVPGGVTVMLTVWDFPRSSLTVMVVLPGPTGVTEKFAEGPEPEAGETVATVTSPLFALIFPL